MADKPFSVHLNLDDIARDDIAAALRRHDATREGDRPAAAEIAHHGARDARQAARERSGRDHAGRASGASGGRSYAFRRS